MSLELAPQTETRLYEYAAAEGVSIDAYVNRLLEKAAPRQPDAKALQLLATIRQWQMEDATDDEDELTQRDQARAETQASLDQERQRTGMRPLFPGQG